MKNFLIVCLLFLSNSLFAQNFRVYWKEDTILIGAQTQLIIECLEREKNPEFKPWKGTIQAEFSQNKSVTTSNSVEIIDFSDTILNQNKQSIWRGTYTITAWDTGQVQLPAFQNILRDSTFSISANPLVVVFDEQEFDPNIEEVKVIQESVYNLINLLIVLFFIGAIILVVWFVWKRKKRLNEPPISFQQKAILDLEKLKHDEIWKLKKYNEHYIRFSVILRVFLGHRYDLYLMERTTEETLILLRIKELDTNHFQTIQFLLEQADRVKFGKENPSDLHILEDLNQAIELIHELEITEPIE